jgi:hypothetical protein
MQFKVRYNVVMNATHLIATKKDEILRAATRHGAKNVRIFGSLVRGEASHDSDIDLLVDLEPGRSLLDHVGLIHELEELLGCPVDVVVEGGISPYLERSILAEAIPL